MFQGLVSIHIKVTNKDRRSRAAVMVSLLWVGFIFFIPVSLHISTNLCEKYFE